MFYFYYVNNPKRKLKGEIKMKDIYGYKDNDLLGLANYLRENNKHNLSECFGNYALKIGKAKGTVRNMYYALVRACEENPALKNKYLLGLDLTTEKFVEFSEQETEELVRKVLKGVIDGRSVRNTIIELSKGDLKLALRYQNKYRSVVKKSPQLVGKLLEELRGSKPLSNDAPHVKIRVPDSEMYRLRKEIDNLVNKISYKTKKENEMLKERIRLLEIENTHLNALLVSDGKKHKLLDILKGNQKIVN